MGDDEPEGNESGDTGEDKGEFINDQLFNFAAFAAIVVAVGNFPAEEGVEIAVACFVFDFFDEGETDVTTDRTDFFIVDEVGPAEDDADPGKDKECGVVWGCAKGEGDDYAVDSEGGVEEVVAEADALGLFGFEFVVFFEEDVEDGVLVAHGWTSGGQVQSYFSFGELDWIYGGSVMILRFGTS